MNKTVKTILALALAACFCIPAAACAPKEEGEGPVILDTDIVLAEGGRTEYSVVVPAQAEASETYAAELLAEQFEAATGAVIEVRTDGGAALSESAKLLSVGHTSVLESSGVTLGKEELNEDGFKIKRFGNTVVMGGFNGRGTIYSVQEFLKQQFGYEVYAVGEVAIDSVEKAMLKDFDMTEVPAFRERAFDGLAAYNAEYATSLRLNPSTSAAEFDYGNSRDWILAAHAYYQIIPRTNDPTYGLPNYNDPNDAEHYHPEWFASGQLCLTDPDLKATFIENLKSIIKQTPYGKIVSLGENDGTGYCSGRTEQDENGNAVKACSCAEERSAYGLSGYIVRFMNDVVNEVEKDPEIASRGLVYCMFGYTASGSIIPPVNLDTGEIVDESCRPCDKLYVRVTPLNPVCYKHAFSDPDCTYNQSIYQYFKGWKGITDNIAVWDYNTNYSAYYFFYDNFDSLKTNLKFYKDEIGVVYLNRENTTGSELRSLVDLDTYLNAKLMWNPDENVGELMDDFMEHFYKAGAPYMQQYIDLMRSNVNMMAQTRTEGYHLLCYQNPGDIVQYWPKRILEQALDLLEQAQAAYLPLAESDPALYETLYNRVLKESVCVRYMILSNFDTYYPGNSELKMAMLDAFETDAEIVQGTCYREGSSTSDFIESLRG